MTTVNLPGTDTTAFGANLTPTIGHINKRGEHIGWVVIARVPLKDGGHRDMFLGEEQAPGIPRPWFTKIDLLIDLRNRELNLPVKRSVQFFDKNPDAQALSTQLDYSKQSPGGTRTQKLYTSGLDPLDPVGRVLGI